MTPTAATPAQPDATAAAIDVHSAARPHEVVVRHTGLDLSVDFDAKVLTGAATIAVERLDATAPLRLDTRDIDIRKVWVGTVGDARPLATADGGWTEATFELQKASPIFGSALVVELPEGADAVRIEYATVPEASGLQWLAPEQTAGGKAPFLYTQSQAIHARSWVPCQDTPGVRSTFDATVHVSDGLTALMAASAAPSERPGVFQFVMDQPIPSYLVAMAVGAVEFQELGPRSGVWAEPPILQKAVAEFGDVETMIDAVEGLYGPYRWGRYDILVLPPAFPFGGMENPRLTFATPTILAGDRSLVALIAHELAHSWSGNLVTNASWGDLWLNEGFTVYVERRVVESLYGREREEMEAMLGRQDLEDELAELPEADQRLSTDLAGRDPDDGLTNVPYEKGALLLRLLEETYGREVFDPFLQRWFSEHAFTSVRTADFETFVKAELIDKATPLQGKAPVDLDAWIRGSGMGPNSPAPTSAAFETVEAALAKLLAGEIAAPELPTKDWTPHEWLHFLRALPASMSPEDLAALDAAFGLTTSSNAEILAQWLEVAVRRNYRTADGALETFLVGVGRRKFLTPLYRALLESDRKADAQQIYAKARAGYHPITQRTLDALVQG
ncbi:MAG: M1 family metallopeptidase [Myxococcota bacterium]